MQELKAQEADLSDDMKNPHGMHGYWHCAEKRGYSGVAVYSKRKPDNVQIGMGIEEFDREGRFVRCDFGKLSVISLYLPSGSSAEERQQVKYRFLDAFYPMLEAMKNEGRDIVVCGDWNIAQPNIELEKLEGQSENSGFLPEEREWIAKSSTSSVGRICGAHFIPMCRAIPGGAIADKRMRKMSGGVSIIRWLRRSWPPKLFPHMFIKTKILGSRPFSCGV